jgi:VanZ family protein
MLVLLACALPRQNLPEAPGVTASIPFLDRWVHFAIFGLWSALWSIALPGRRAALAIFALGAVYGGFTELLQGWLGWGRTADVIDWVADLVGVALGIGLALAITSRGERLPIESTQRAA